MALTVLIVDDNTSLAYFTAFSLKQELEGLTVVTAGTCEEALAMAHEYRPSVFIVDLRLPDGDGLELIENLRSHFPNMVPILITATPLSTDVKRDLFGMLTKPYEPEALVELVRQALQTEDSRPGQTAGDQAPEATAAGSVQYDYHRVQNRLSALLGGIRALKLEMYAVAEEPPEIRRIMDEYSDRLSALVKDAAETLKRKA